MRYIKKHFKILCLIGIFILFILYIVSGAIIFSKLTSIPAGYAYPDNSPASFDFLEVQDLYPDDPIPILDASKYFMKEFETVTFPSLDSGIVLSAWYIPAKTITKQTLDKAIIVVPGYTQSKANYRQLMIAGLLHEYYNVLILDLRNTGMSTITTGRTTLGNTEYKDILAAKQWLKTQGIQKIGLVGVSLGASTVAIAFSYDKTIQAALLDSPFTSMKNIVQEELARLSIPRFLWLPSYVVGRVFFKTNMLKYNITDILVENTGNRNLMFFHAKKDKRVNIRHSTQAYNALQETNAPHVSAWFYDSDEHATQMIRDPNAHQERMLAFFNKAFSRVLNREPEVVE